MSAPHTTVTLFRFPTAFGRWWIFTQMGRVSLGMFPKVAGLSFGRLMGSGGGNGFGLWPNFGTYAWVGQWENKAAAQAFEQSAWFCRARELSENITTFHLAPTMAHGEWEGQQPFPLNTPYDPQLPVAVITRATIRTSKLPDFWRYVPRTSRSVYDHSARLLSIGIGEYPVFMQATFSYWTSGKAMQDFAYRSDYHKEVVQLTRERDWYKEELFVRFTVLEIDGEISPFTSNAPARLGI